MIKLLNITDEQSRYWGINFEQMKFPAGMQDKINKRCQANIDNYRYGFLAQIVVADFLKAERPKPYSGFDGGIDIVYEGKSIDVILRTGNNPPQPHFEYQVYERKADYPVKVYFFTYYNRMTPSLLYLPGYLPKDEVTRLGRPRKIGDMRILDNGKIITYEDNCLEVFGRDLYPLDE